MGFLRRRKVETASTTLEERQAAIDRYAEEVAITVASDESGSHQPGSVTVLWTREDGSTAMMSVSAPSSGGQATLPPEPLQGLAAGGRAAIVYDWGAADEAVAAGVGDYEVVALVGPFPDRDGSWQKATVFGLSVTGGDDVRAPEFVDLGEERNRELLEQSLPALQAMVGA